MDALDTAIRDLWLGILQVAVWAGLTATCVGLLLDLVHEHEREVEPVFLDVSLVLAAAFILDAEIVPSQVPVGLLASFVLLGIAAGRRWQRAEARPT